MVCQTPETHDPLIARTLADFLGVPFAAQSFEATFDFDGLDMDLDEMEQDDDEEAEEPPAKKARN